MTKVEEVARNVAKRTYDKSYLFKCSIIDRDTFMLSLNRKGKSAKRIIKLSNLDIRSLRYFYHLMEEWTYDMKEEIS